MGRDFQQVAFLGTRDPHPKLWQIEHVCPSWRTWDMDRDSPLGGRVRSKELVLECSRDSALWVLVLPMPKTYTLTPSKSLSRSCFEMCAMC